MTDYGIGYPDLVFDDDIYSRYLTTFPFPGKYVLTITVTDNSNTAYVGNADGGRVPAQGHWDIYPNRVGSSGGYC